MVRLPLSRAECDGSAEKQDECGRHCTTIAAYGAACVHVGVRLHCSDRGRERRDAIVEVADHDRLAPGPHDVEIRVDLDVEENQKGSGDIAKRAGSDWVAGPSFKRHAVPTIQCSKASMYHAS